MAEPNGDWHSCTAGKVLPEDMVNAVTCSVTPSDKYLADAFIKRIALYRWLYPRKHIDFDVFINGTLSDRQYLRTCSDKAFAGIMKTGVIGILQKR